MEAITEKEKPKQEGELYVGQFVETVNIPTEQDVLDFAQISGDKNPMHIDSDYAAKTEFGERVAHGALVASYISGLIGMRLPGPGSFVISLNLKFRDAVKLGEEVKTRVEVKKLCHRFVKLRFVSSVKEKTVIKGEATVSIPKKPEYVGDWSI